MPSSYLNDAEYPVYGVSGATSDQVTQASILVDAFLQRPEGLIYVPDATGLPCYMAAALPELTLTSVGAFSPGSNVAVQVTGPLLNLQIGDVLILDRTANPALDEACVISAIAGPPASPLTVTLKSVQNAHALGCYMETGLVITEQKAMPQDRTTTRLSRTPLMQVVGGTGRYGYGRRSDSGGMNVDDFNLLASLSKFGGPPAWELWDPATAGIDEQTGELWVPAGIMMAYYSQVKVRYVAGFAAASLPACVKLATAQLTQAMNANPLFGNVRSFKSGENTMLNATSSYLSVDVKSMLQKYSARSFGC